jgi:hypothetical protein
MAPVKTAVRIGGGARGPIFEGKVESVELGWKLKEAQIGDVIPTVATDLEKNGPVLIVSLEVLHSYRCDQRKLYAAQYGLWCKIGDSLQ